MIEKIKKVPKIFYFILVLVFVGVLLYILIINSVSGPLPPVPDNKRMVDITEIRTIMILFHDANLKYFQSSSTPVTIEQYEIPKDPKGNPYEWIDNTSESQKFCVWAKFERKSGYVIASHCGAKEVNHQPVSLDDCCELSKP